MKNEHPYLKYKSDRDSSENYHLEVINSLHSKFNRHVFRKNKAEREVLKYLKSNLDTPFLGLTIFSSDQGTFIKRNQRQNAIAIQ